MLRAAAGEATRAWPIAAAEGIIARKKSSNERHKTLSLYKLECLNSKLKHKSTIFIHIPPMSG